MITIDGPAGSGKSTVSALLAKRLALNFLTTGAFYRGIALLCQVRKIDISNPNEVVKLASDKGFKVIANVHGTQVFIDDRDVTDQLNNEDVAAVASRISAFPEVRQALLEPQRRFNHPPGLIAEGRDCGTIVFPDALVKIFLTANLDARAQRRSHDDRTASPDQQLQKIAKRDQADSQRKVAPMAKAADAIEIDTSSMSIEEVVDQIEEIVRKRGS